MTTPRQLEDAIRATAGGDAEALAVLAGALLDAHLVVPVRDDGQGGASLVTLQRDGAPYVPAWTRPELAAAAVPPGQPTTRVPVRTLVEAWNPQVALALNPGAQPAGWLDGSGVVALGDDRRVPVPADTAVRVGEPADEPVDFLAAVARALAHDPLVVRAHRAQVHFGASGEVPHLLLALVVDGDQDLADARAAALAGSLPDGHDGPVDVIGLSATAPREPLAEEVLGLPPFHVRP
ncbi:enhanced serine sensitivity protein SseB C-terminal domain-containing protein [Egicoccus halophilus]|uniref:SseB protein N-terminal domain-containing protein n=1 Tax=Egicoccus halophilus TaxID=1670830 RepID=A0A8J3ESG7_9ACTN|nr:enhanced serine sensitivity protein SseB C-terminal domain-containing protein [Egicoccus halophilus]GGI03264.1 hypothetical protein GCM10011354_03180 [Egicoccus halophilus]